MNRIFILIAGLFLTNLALAQKQFEGKIIYNLHASMDEKKGEPDAELTAVFSSNKMKLYFKKEGKDDPEAIILNMDSGKIYTVNSEIKRYSVKDLKEKPAAQPMSSRTFVGYKAMPVQANENGLGSLLGGVFASSEFTFFVSDSLIFNVPEKYSRNAELILVNKNHLVLGADIKLGAFMGSEGDAESKENLITAAATMISPMPISPAEFVIPSDYINKIDDFAAADSSAAMDKIEMAMDTPVAVSKKPVVKKTSTKKTTPRKITGNKSSAAIRKP